MAGTPTRKNFADCMHQALLNTRRRWRAINDEGEYLHMNGIGFTPHELWAWRGTGAQFKSINKVHNGSLRPVEAGGEE